MQHLNFWFRVYWIAGRETKTITKPAGHWHKYLKHAQSASLKLTTGGWGGTNIRTVFGIIQSDSGIVQSLHFKTMVDHLCRRATHSKHVHIPCANLAINQRRVCPNITKLAGYFLIKLLKLLTSNSLCWLEPRNCRLQLFFFLMFVSHPLTSICTQQTSGKREEKWIIDQKTLKRNSINLMSPSQNRTIVSVFFLLWCRMFFTEWQNKDVISIMFDITINIFKQRSFAIQWWHMKAVRQGRRESEQMLSFPSAKMCTIHEFCSQSLSLCFSLCFL